MSFRIYFFSKVYHTFIVNFIFHERELGLYEIQSLNSPCNTIVFIIHLNVRNKLTTRLQENITLLIKIMGFTVFFLDGESNCLFGKVSLHTYFHSWTELNSKFSILILLPCSEPYEPLIAIVTHSIAWIIRFSLLFLCYSISHPMISPLSPSITWSMWTQKVNASSFLTIFFSKIWSYSLSPFFFIILFPSIENFSTKGVVKSINYSGFGF